MTKKEKEERIMELFIQIETLVAYSNQEEIIDSIENILNPEDKELFQELRQDTIDQTREKFIHLAV